MKIKEKPTALKLVAAVLSFLIISSVLPYFAVTASAAITPSTPQKDTDGVYQIGTAEELYWFADKVNNDNANYGSASAVLTKDIVVNKGVLKDDGTLNSGTFTDWTPIGNYDNRYTGKFDGQGHTISGLYFNNTGADYVGLFGVLGSGSEIKKVGVIDSYVRGYKYVGGVCGWNGSSGTITGCYNAGTVIGPYKLGGVCGWNSGTITGCYNTGTVSGTGNYVGGVCGWNGSSGTITGCYNTGTVSGSSYVGGVCGENCEETITGCYNTGTVIGDNIVGGVCGQNFQGIINGCYSTGTVRGTSFDSQYIGGVCGTGNGSVTDCDVKTDAEFANGTVCGLLNTALKNENSDVHFYQGVKLPELIRTPQLVGGVYQIGTLTELFGFAQLVNSGNKGAKAVLTADIVVNTGVLKDDGTLNSGTFTDWTPIGNGSKLYTGKFDGQGHTISGLYFNDTSAENVGLFGYIGENGEIKNVGVIDSYFNGANCVGGVCGYNDEGTITDCYNTGTVIGKGDVGGVCGWNYYGDNGKITGCYNTGTVSGTSNYVGGVCGYNNDSTITGCYNTGTVRGTGSNSKYVGGVCGYNDLGKITGCYNTGTVSGKSYVGGVCGKNYNGKITGCYTNRIGDTYYLSDTEFKNGTVCGLLNTALKNANADVRFYQGVKSPEFIRTPQLVDGVYQISCASELYGFAQLVNGGNTDKNTKAVLTADIIVNKDVLNDSGGLNTGTFTDWTPIGYYKGFFTNVAYSGTFDGQGHTISGLYNNTGTDSVGLFGYLGSGGEIKNVGVIDSYFNGNGYVGGVCGYSYSGTITGCYNTGKVSGSGDYVGGVCGYNFLGTITGCYNTGKVSGKVSGSGDYVGGVCGYSNVGRITGSYNTGTVSGNSASTGGVCGYNNIGTITGCYTNKGGVCGYNNSGTITGCDEYKGVEFTNSTVCKLLNNALKNANSDVRFCQRIGTDASPLQTYQFESIDEHTVDTYTVDNNTFKLACLCGKKTAKTMELTLKTEKPVVLNGADNTLTAELSNLKNEAVTYKWYQNDTLIEGATLSTYKMPSDLLLGTYTYKVDVSMEGAGTITQSVDVLVDITPQYYVNIPATVNNGDDFTVEASGVLLKNNAQLKVSLLSDFILTNEKGTSLNYEILTLNGKLTSGDTLLTVQGSQDPKAPGSGTSETYNVALAQGETLKHSGNYTDTLTFTIKVEP